MSHGICFRVVDIAGFGITKLNHFYSLFMGLSFNINTRICTFKMSIYLVSSQLF